MMRELGIPSISVIGGQNLNICYADATVLIADSVRKLEIFYRRKQKKATRNVIYYKI